MCGIVGVVNRASDVDQVVLTTMRDTLVHRGPDDAGLYVSKDKKTGLGHRRLSLLDLSENGRQPLANEDETVFATVNGEIYNHAELRRELEALGHSFKSTSDSEVIVHGYEEWGEDILNRLKGMFAFGIWDERKGILFLARDRFGIKPVYYFQDEERFVFASEIKAIIADKTVPKEVDLSAVADYLFYRYVPSPKSIWKHIKKIPPAHCLTLHSGKVSIRKYWDLNTAKLQEKSTEVVKTVDKYLETSIQTHTMGDVPIGSFLSGGYDSSALVHYMHRAGYPTSTFSIGFEHWEESEHQYAEIVADKFSTDHQSLVIGDESLGDIRKLSYYFDEPIADISIGPTYRVSNLASKKVKAVLSGEGADEIFAGYTWHRSFHELNKGTKGLSRILNSINGSQRKRAIEHYQQSMSMGLFDRTELENILDDRLHGHIPNPTPWFYEEHVTSTTPVKTMQRMDLSCFMGELVLTKIDRASMANSLEVRVPFLDHELVEYVMALDESSYYKEDETKHLLRENIKDVMPQTILQRKKQGFVGPDSYYQNIDWYRDNLLEGQLIQRKIVKKTGLDRLIEHEEYWKLWKLIVLEFWFQEWV